LYLIGETGKALTNEILKNDIFKSTTLIGRRTVNFTEDYYKNSIQKVIDFDKMSENEDAFKDLDVLYCCLGTTRGKSGAVT
jgi:oxidoreductase